VLGGEARGLMISLPGQIGRQLGANPGEDGLADRCGLAGSERHRRDQTLQHPWFATDDARQQVVHERALHQRLRFGFEVLRGKLALHQPGYRAEGKPLHRPGRDPLGVAHVSERRGPEFPGSAAPRISLRSGADDHMLRCSPTGFFAARFGPRKGELPGGRGLGRRPDHVAEQAPALGKIREETTDLLQEYRRRHRVAVLIGGAEGHRHSL
jgi:hypothetical protein